MWYSRSTPPEGWLVCNGQSTVAYPELAAVVGPNVPDLRGEFIRGWDAGRGTDPGRILGSLQIDEFKSHTHTGSGNGAAIYSDGMPKWLSGYNFETGVTGATGGTETRPRNIALLPCIKY